MIFELASMRCTVGTSGAIAAAMQHTAHTLHFTFDIAPEPALDSSFAASATGCWWW